MQLNKKGDIMPNQPPTYPQQMPVQPPMGGMAQQPTMDDERIQEIAESIIDEKWSDLIKNVQLILDWKQNVEGRLAKIQQQFTDLKESFDKLHEGVLGKVGEYDKHVGEVGTELKALEQVFSKILPGFMENVNELSRITGYLKKKQQEKKI